MFEEFKLNTITKAEFLSGIEDKADKDEIANIVSPPAFSPIIRSVDPCLKDSFRHGLENVKIKNILDSTRRIR